MKNITVSKEELVSALTANRTQHVIDYNDSMAGYWEQAEKRAQRLLEQVKAKRTDEYLHIDLQRPESHEKDYDTALEMLEWHENDTIEVSQSEFKQFIQDEWSWKRQFAATTQTYTTSAPW